MKLYLTIAALCALVAVFALLYAWNERRRAKAMKELADAADNAAREWREIAEGVLKAQRAVSEAKQQAKEVADEKLETVRSAGSGLERFNAIMAGLRS